ncbi:hypothetical protein CPHO_08245 [Corynebacterium phocae]|uniref:Uncharacterized protein n=1 Tax=Corynebacterium phocae TaxID=161895 RepID=A0A1L7D3Y6_9CORY|nr:hypothetical protein [Corynebacterium phocae]APT92876.1 hypothetical protein CPHO_08245 [Corynebacterium phocae]KAA8723198.1 hypothetical protein F4V58_07750 [Corynebacterium phocae]
MTSEVLTFAGVALTALVTYAVARMKTSVEKHTAKADRLTQLEQRLEALGRRLDEEIAARREAQTRAYETGRALRQAVAWIHEVTEWIQGGSKPPAPELVDISVLEKAIPPP